MRSVFVVAFLLGAAAVGQETAPAGEQITFLPPPIEGTVSVGVYTREGKLVRVLAQEATDKNFTVGLNGFITHWDGKDAAGAILPAGTYFVRGYGVGEIEVEGMAFHGNDWIKDENSPRMAEVRELAISDDVLTVVGAKLGGKDRLIAEVNLNDASVKFVQGAEVPERENGSAPANAWSIERAADSNPPTMAVVQRSADGSEVLRRLDYEPSEPRPQAVLASADNQKICLLERNESETRVRILTLQETAKTDDTAVSKWGIRFSASIRRPPAPAELAGFLNRTPPVKPEESIRQALVPNELSEVSQAAVQLAVAVDDRGSFLRTKDGLPLRRVTDTQNLQWAVLSSETDGTLSLFQSDGATVEEYRLRKLDQMMAFDAGDYEWTPAK